MTPQQIDQKVRDYLDRAASMYRQNTSASSIEIAKLIQEEEHHQEQMELIERLEKS